MTLLVNFMQQTSCLTPFFSWLQTTYLEYRCGGLWCTFSVSQSWQLNPYIQNSVQQDFHLELYPRIIHQSVSPLLPKDSKIFQKNRVVNFPSKKERLLWGCNLWLLLIFVFVEFSWFERYKFRTIKCWFTLHLHMNVLGWYKFICFVYPFSLSCVLHSIDICTIAIKYIGNMHAVSTNQIADILYFNDNYYYLERDNDKVLKFYMNNSSFRLLSSALNLAI